MKSLKSRIPTETTPENEDVSPAIPPDTRNEDKPGTGHSRSHAAHLNSAGEPHTTIPRNLNKGTIPMGRKQP